MCCFFLPWFSNHLETILKKYLCHNGFSFKKYTLQLSWIPIAHISLLSGVRILSQTEFFGYHQMWNATETTSYKRINEFWIETTLNMFYLLMIEMFLRSSFAQRISSKGQSYFHNPLFTLWISVDVIGSCSLLNQNLALFATSIQY